MTTPTETAVSAKITRTIDAINNRLDSIQEQMAWMIRAEQRFHVGQRVEWSASGRKKGFPSRKKAKRGTVKAVDGFSVVVKLDGLKKETSFHHAFFNPVSGPKLF